MKLNNLKKAVELGSLRNELMIKIQDIAHLQNGSLHFSFEERKLLREPFKKALIAALGEVEKEIEGL